MTVHWCLSGLLLAVTILIPSAIGVYGAAVALAIGGLFGSVATLVVSSVGVVVLASVASVGWLLLLLLPSVLS